MKKDEVSRDPLIDKLNSCSTETVHKFSFSTDGQRVACKVISVYDGDTLSVAMPLEPKRADSPVYSFKVRLAGIDTPEMKPSLTEPNRELVISLAKRAKRFLEEETLGKIMYIEISGEDKYGRLLGTLFRDTQSYEEKSINQEMIKGNYALPYDGTEKKSFPV